MPSFLHFPVGASISLKSPYPLQSLGNTGAWTTPGPITGQYWGMDCSWASHWPGQWDRHSRFPGRLCSAQELWPHYVRDVMEPPTPLSVQRQMCEPRCLLVCQTMKRLKKVSFSFITHLFTFCFCKSVFIGLFMFKLINK